MWSLSHVISPSFSLDVTVKHRSSITRKHWLSAYTLDLGSMKHDTRFSTLVCRIFLRFIQARRSFTLVKSDCSTQMQKGLQHVINTRWKTTIPRGLWKTYFPVISPWRVHVRIWRARWTDCEWNGGWGGTGHWNSFDHKVFLILFSQSFLFLSFCLVMTEGLTPDGVLGR